MSVITAPSAGRQARASSVGRPEAFYPSPFFDIAENYLPSTIRETFEWCAYYQRTNPIISTVTSRLAAYPITDIMFDEGNEGLVEEWRDLFETKLRIRQFLVEQNLDRYTFGNSFCTVSFPFIKKLTCRQCDHAVEAAKAKYQWRDMKFMLHCQECDTQHEAKVHDEYQKNLEAVRLVRWNPRVIEIEYNEITGRSRYFYQMPQYLRNQITLGIPDVVQNVPQTFIDALRKKKAILIESDKIFHSRRASISTNPGDQGWGAPLVLPVLKDIFFTQVLRKSQEAVCMEHIVPMRVLYPQVTGDGNNFYSQVNLKSWQKEVELQVTKWRQDPNHIPVLGFPLGYQLIGGQGRAMLLHQELRVYFDQIVAGMGVPTSFFYGEAQYCLRGDTLVPTARGLMQLSELAPLGTGETTTLDLPTATHSGEHSIRRAHNVGEKEEWVVETAFGFKLNGSADHKALVLRSDMSTDFVKFSDLSEGDFVIFKEGAELWPDTSTHGVTTEEARILGYLVAEGTVTQMLTKGRNRVSFDNTDPEAIDDFVDCWETTFGKRPHVSWREFEGGNYPCGHVEVSSVSAMERLHALGLRPVRSLGQTVPVAIRTAPREAVCEFLRTYFDGDGGVCAHDADKNMFSVTAASRSEQLLREIQLLLLNLGIVGGVRFDSEQEMWVLRLAGRNLHRYAAEVGFVSERKCAALDTIQPGRNNQNRELKIPFLRGHVARLRKEHFTGKSCLTNDGRKLQLHVPQYGVTYGTVRKKVNLETVRELEPELARNVEYLLENEFRFAEVQSVGRSGVTVPMYDLTVDTAHSYQANGLLTHNSGASVNLKALENEFLGNRQDMLRLVHFIRDAIAGGCDKTPIGMRFRPFKMADDIQRASYDLQLSQAGLISQRSLLQSRDFDYAREQTLLKTERSVQARVSRQQIVDQAEAQGEAQIIQAKYGAQAQVQQQEILNQNGMAAPEQQQQQGQEQQGAAGQQAQQGQPQQPGQEQQAQPGQEQQPVESAGGQNLAVAARTVAQQLSAMSEVDQYHRLEQLRANNPNLYELVFRDLKSQGVRLRPNPEQLPPRGP